MSPEAAEAELFDDALACEETRPADFLPSPSGQAPAADAGTAAEAFLQAIAVVEDSRADDPDEHGPQSLALHRIEAKLDLLGTLLARLIGQQGAQQPWRALRWSALGARLVVDAPSPAGTRGQFLVQPTEWLPQTLQLPATVLACVTEGNEARLWLRFEPLSPGLSAALERHLFRVHRRAVAESRRPR